MNQILSLGSSYKSSGEDGLDYRQVRLIIDKAILLNDENPDGSVAKYAFSAILEAGMSSIEAEKYVEDALFKYAFYYPTLIPLLYRWLQKYKLGMNVSGRLYDILEKSFKSGQSDNVVWCIFLIIRCDPGYKTEIIAKAIKDQSPMVILMAYVYAKSFGESVEPLKDWANALISKLASEDIMEYDLDQYWIVLYQLFLDGEIKQPYTAQEDQKVFACLKKQDVSFVAYDHDMLKPIHLSLPF